MQSNTLLKIKRPILLFLKLPPPTTGATMINQYVAENFYNYKSFKVNLFKIQYNKVYNKIGSEPILKVLYVLKFSLVLIKKLIFNRPEFIYFQISPLGYAFFRDLIYVILMKLFRIKIIFHLHGKGIKQAAENNIISKHLYRFAFKNNYVICLSELIASDISDVYANRPYIVNNGIPVTINKLDLSNKNTSVVRLLFVSNIRRQKGILDFIQVCENLKNRDILFSASIIGQERDLSSSELIKYIKDKGLSDCLSYQGPKFGNEKNQEYLESDILIHPPYNEAWGLVLLEAMEAGLPIVTTNEGSIPYIIDDNVTGFICEKGDIDCLTKRVLELINNRSLRIKMGLAGRKKFLESFTIDRFNENICKVFEEVYIK